MTYRMIYLVGQPGAGKSTLMADLTEQFDRLTREEPVPHDCLIDRRSGSVHGVEIGRRREAFSGTDALASAIIDKAVPWILHRPCELVLGEGARLGNKRFLESAIEAGYDVTLALLDHDQAEDWRAIRSKQLKRTQNESWVRGRLSASRNLADALKGKARVLRGHPDQLREGLAELIADV
jgi:GTPase SAR1 family protein